LNSLALLRDILIRIVMLMMHSINDWFKTKTKPSSERLAVGACGCEKVDLSGFESFVG
jgi:hypothetical protein